MPGFTKLVLLLTSLATPGFHNQSRAAAIKSQVEFNQQNSTTNHLSPQTAYNKSSGSTLWTKVVGNP
jgi:hypothetical protein